MIKTVKKVMAVGTGAAMMGATLGTGVLAQDLSAYPSPFIQNGQFNGLIVVGDQADSSDVLGSIDIATSLQYAARVERTVATDTSASSRTTFSSTGEAWRVGTSSRSLVISEIGTGANIVNESLSDFSELTSDELPVILKDGTVRVGGGTVYEYEQTLKLGPAKVMLAENDDDEIELSLNYEDEASIADYTLEFSTDLETDVVSGTAKVSTKAASGILDDLEGREIEVLGKTWSILNARTSGATNAELTLMGGSATDILDEDGTKDHTVAGKAYKVVMGPITSGRGDIYRTTFTVNGERTDTLEEGDTYTLKDGSVIGVKNIQVQNFFGGVRTAEYYLGANKVILKDINIEDETVNSKLEIQDEKVDNTYVDIKGERTDTGEMSIESIKIMVDADDDLFVQSRRNGQPAS